MTLTEKDVKRISVIFLAVVLGVLTYFIIKPVLLSIIAGLILAYIFYPVYKWVLKFVKSRNISAGIVTVIILLLIILPIWFLAPIISKNVFELYQSSRNLDVYNIVRETLPSQSDQIVNQISLAVENAIGKLSSIVLNTLVDFLVNFAIVTLHVLLVGFVFFFALRDEKELREFVSGLSPLNKKQEKELVNQFQGITKSIIYGQIVIGLVQGILTGLGLWLFGVPHAFLLAILAVIFGVIPVIGPSLVYLPVTVYIIIVGSPFLAVGYLLYNFLLVSTIENVVRAHLVSRKTNLSQVIILIGMVGGFLIFGFLGLILGPLILAYFLTFLRAYKERTLSSVFAP